MEREFQGPFVIENEADNSAHTGSRGATVQGFRAALLSLAPIVWPLNQEAGYQFDRSKAAVLKEPRCKDIPVVTMKELKIKS